MRLFLALAVSVSVLAAPMVAFAQAARPERPYRGLFGSGYGDTEQSLTGTVSTGVGYDDNVYAGDNGNLLPQSDVPRSSQFSSFGASLGYSVGREKISLYANGSASGQYYFDLRRPLVGSYGASTGLSWQASKRTQVSANGSFSYAPFSAFSFFPSLNELEPGVAPPPNALPPGNYGTIRAAFVTANSSVSVSRQLSQRSSLSGSLARGTTYNTSGEFSASTVSATGSFSHSLSKGLGLRAGYGYMRADYGGDQSAVPPVVGRTIDLGVSYNHALSFSRRTTLSFSTGSSAYNYASITSYHVTGDAVLNHEIGRSWNASLSFNRGVSFLNQLAAPTIADSLTAGVTGLITHRVHFHGSVAGSSGQVGFTQGNDFGSWTWSTGASFDTHRLVSLSVQYRYDPYTFDQTGFLILGVPPQFDRHSVQANVSVFLPIFERMRRPNASR